MAGPVEQNYYEILMNNLKHVPDPISRDESFEKCVYYRQCSCSVLKLKSACALRLTNSHEGRAKCLQMYAHSQDLTPSSFNVTTSREQEALKS